MLFILILIIFIFEKQILAGEDFIPSREAMAYAFQQAKEIQKGSTKLIKDKAINKILESKQNSQSCSSQLLNKGKNANQGCIKNLTTQLLEKDKTTQILVFVSFSMPELSLKSLFQEAPLHNAVLVMQGLYQDSFVKTAQKLQQIGVTIDINPELFETHNITSVPAFVVLKNGQPIHMLKGNVTLKFASQKFRDQFIENTDISLKSKGALCS